MAKDKKKDITEFLKETETLNHLAAYMDVLLLALKKKIDITSGCFSLIKPGIAIDKDFLLDQTLVRLLSALS